MYILVPLKEIVHVSRFSLLRISYLIEILRTLEIVQYIVDGFEPLCPGSGCDFALFPPVAGCECMGVCE